MKILKGDFLFLYKIILNICFYRMKQTAFPLWSS